MTSAGKPENLRVKRLDSQLDNVHAVGFKVVQDFLIYIVRPCGKVNGADLAGILVLFGDGKKCLLILHGYPGERTAEELKLTIGTAFPRDEVVTKECRGRDLVTGLPKSVDVTSDEMMDALEEPLYAISEAVHNVLERTPPELAADISNSGIIITGGGALLYGIDKRIEDRTGIKVIIAEDPKSCVAIGTGKALDELDKLEGNSLNRRAPYL